jgi:Na+-driven multidrug efflux pump
MMAIFNFQLSKYGGDIAISAWGAINSIMLFILMPIFGLNQGSQPIIGFNFGAKNCLRIRETLKMTIFVSSLIVITGFIMIQIFARPIIGAFSKNDPHLVDVGSTGLRIFLAMLPVIGFQITGSNYFQSVGKPLYSMLLTLSRQILLLIPMVLILPHFLGLFGIWLAGPVSDFLSFLLTFTFILRELKKLKTMERCV